MHKNIKYDIYIIRKVISLGKQVNCIKLHLLAFDKFNLT